MAVCPPRSSCHVLHIPLVSYCLICKGFLNPSKYILKMAAALFAKTLETCLLKVTNVIYSIIKMLTLIHITFI
jgi:hypothetical protein